MQFEKPLLTVDAILLTLIEGRLHVAIKLREADDPPSEKGKWEATGGVIHTNTDLNDMDAVKRTLHAKLGFEPSYLEQCFTEANATRDPRGWSASIVFLALNEPTVLQALVAERGMQLVDAEDDGAHLPDNMAFDHRLLILRAIEKLRAKNRYSTIAAHFLPQQFLLSDFHAAFQALRQKVVNPANFRTKILAENVLVKMDDPLFSGGRPGTGYYLAQPIAYFDRTIA